MQTNPTLFGEFFKKARLETGQTLRGSCLAHGYDPGNISKIERGRLTPPQGGKKLKEWATSLGLKESTDKYQEFFDLAYACNGIVPPEILSNEEVVKKLPLTFKALRLNTGSTEQRDRLVETIQTP